MSKYLSNKRLTLINLTIVSYFVLIWLLISFQIEHVLIGVFIELLTIPFLIAQLVFLVIGIKQIVKEPTDLLTKVSVFLLVISAVVTVGSFF